MYDAIAADVEIIGAGSQSQRGTYALHDEFCRKPGTCKTIHSRPSSQFDNVFGSSAVGSRVFLGWDAGSWLLLPMEGGQGQFCGMLGYSP